MTKKLALLSTSTARKIRYEDNKIVESKASPRLLELLDQGYEVYIVSTRAKLFPDGCDKCLFDLIPEERFFTPLPELDCGGSDSPGLVELWERVLNRFNIEIPENDSEWGRTTWLQLRSIATRAGVITQ